MAKAVPLAPPQVAAAEAAASAAKSVGEGLVKAATTPIFTRTKKERWDPELEEWVPDTRETAVNATLAAVAVFGALALAAGALGQRAFRTGVLQPVTQYEFEVTLPGPGDADRPLTTEAVATGKRKKVWSTDANYRHPVEGSTTRETGRKRTRAKVRAREDVADYQPLARGL